MTWTPGNVQHEQDAKKLDVWPLDEHNAVLLNEVHPRDYTQSSDEPHEVYDLIAIGAGAGGLVTSKQVRILHCRRRIHCEPCAHIIVSPLAEERKAP